MAVSRLDNNGDWTFGQGRANYATLSNETAQNVVTRIKSFKDDWVLDTEANIDWFTILGNKNNEQTIKSEIRRVTLATYGVRRITKLEVVSDRETRNAAINLGYDDIYGAAFLQEIGINDN